MSATSAIVIPTQMPRPPEASTSTGDESQIEPIPICSPRRSASSAGAVENEPYGAASSGFGAQRHHSCLSWRSLLIGAIPLAVSNLGVGRR